MLALLAPRLEPKEQALEDYLRTSTAVMARTWKAGTWLGSGLLRRLALFHTRSTAYAVDGSRGNHVAYVRWCVRTYHLPEVGTDFGAVRAAAALQDPHYGLGLSLVRFRGDTDPGSGAQMFFLQDTGGTGRLELLAEAEPAPQLAGNEDVAQAVRLRLAIMPKPAASAADWLPLTRA